MPIFTFMGSNILRRDNPYSLQVITETIDTVIPPLIRVRRERWREGEREGYRERGRERGTERGWREGGKGGGGREGKGVEGGREGEWVRSTIECTNRSTTVYYILLSYIDFDTIEDLNKFCYPIS